MKNAQPKAARLIAAGFAAALVAPAPVAFMLIGSTGNPVENVLSALPLVLLFGAPVALLHVFLIGVPLYLALRRRWRLRWWSAPLAGFLIGALPMALLFQSLEGMWFFGLCGLVGGLVFWAVLRPGPPPDDAGDLKETFA